ncbi:hypothetical protein STENM327S_02569 [Streptomyces tendae]
MRERRSGLFVEEYGHGAQQDVGRLQGLYAAREERDQCVLAGEAQAGAGVAVRAVRPGAEPFEIHAGVDDGDLVAVGAVVADEFVGLLGRVGDQPVGGVDHLGLADDAVGGFVGVAVGQFGRS